MSLIMTMWLRSTCADRKLISLWNHMPTTFSSWHVLPLQQCPKTHFFSSTNSLEILDVSNHAFLFSIISLSDIDILFHKVMIATNHFCLGLRPTLWDGTKTWYCLSEQGPVASLVMGPNGKSNAIILLKEHINKWLPMTYFYTNRSGHLWLLIGEASSIVHILFII